jgi:hypothetical protein
MVGQSDAETWPKQNNEWDRFWKEVDEVTFTQK